MKYFSWWWYKYLWESEDLVNMWCRIKGHPRGVWFYNTDPTATEPDMTCKDCGEEIL